MLPESVTFALWFNAWRRGAVSLDEARDQIIGADAAHDIVGDGVSVPLILALGQLAGAGPAGAALPVPGDLLGLAGPTEFNRDATATGQAVVLDGGLGLIPARTGAGVVWTRHVAAGGRQVPGLSEADTQLRTALTVTAGRLAALDVAKWNPDMVDELMALRSPVSLSVPVGTSERVERMLGTGSRCLRIVELGLRDDGGALSATEAAARREALEPLERAARRALVAGSGSLDPT